MTPNAGHERDGERLKRPYRVVGVIHLAALPGSALGGTASGLRTLIDAAKRDAIAYATSGVDALMVENFGDVPFVRDAVAPYVIAAMTRAATVIQAETDLPLGVNVLRNDVLSAVGIAAAVGGTFVRANVYVGAALTDQGVIEGQAADVQAAIRRFGAEIDVWADVDVKHAAQIAPRPIGDLAQDAVERGLAAAVIVSGRATGVSVSESDLRAVRQSIGTVPVYVGSGATVETMNHLLQYADGVIVGTAAKVDGVVSQPVDVNRVRSLVRAAAAVSDGPRPQGAV